MKILFKCEDCNLIGWNQEDVSSYTRCPHCGGEFVFMSQKEIFDYQSDTEPDELPENSPYGEPPISDPDLPDWDSPEYWLLTDEDRRFNEENK